MRGGRQEVRANRLWREPHDDKLPCRAALCHGTRLCAEARDEGAPPFIVVASPRVERRESGSSAQPVAEGIAPA